MAVCCNKQLPCPSTAMLILLKHQNCMWLPVLCSFQRSDWCHLCFAGMVEEGKYIFQDLSTIGRWITYWWPQTGEFPPPSLSLTHFLSFLHNSMLPSTYCYCIQYNIHFHHFPPFMLISVKASTQLLLSYQRASTSISLSWMASGITNQKRCVYQLCIMRADHRSTHCTTDNRTLLHLSLSLSLYYQ